MFTGSKANGNPAAVVILDIWLPVETLQQLSKELGEPVTSFIVKVNQGYEIRWFADEVEINLCGHGSLAAAATIFEMMSDHVPDITLVSKHGTVTVTKSSDAFTMTMPSWKALHDPELSKYGDLLGVQPIDVFSTRDLVIVLENKEQVRQFEPNFDKISTVKDFHAIIVTAQNGDNGYVLRYFAPSIGINEDIATGSAQCSLVPYWSARLSPRVLEVTQLSLQGGYFQVKQASVDSIELTANVRLQETVKFIKKDGK
ncbi:PhzF family phenazine biosynthesis protein [Photobacterium sp. OFAV2-7]|nr:PhzF family phenazine biosynthesis protein [Photobacterium sp. OFAV2-7]